MFKNDIISWIITIALLAMALCYGTKFYENYDKQCTQIINHITRSYELYKTAESSTDKDILMVVAAAHYPSFDPRLIEDLEVREFYKKSILSVIKKEP